MLRNKWIIGLHLFWYNMQKCNWTNTWNAKGNLRWRNGKDVACIYYIISIIICFLEGREFRFKQYFGIKCNVAEQERQIHKW